MKRIKLSSENITIEFNGAEDKITPKRAIVRCLKHLYRYNSFTMPKNVMANILVYAHKGVNCIDDHLDISQRLSLFEYLKDKQIEDPYIIQFMKETREIVKI